MPNSILGCDGIIIIIFTSHSHASYSYILTLQFLRLPAIFYDPSILTNDPLKDKKNE